MAYDHIRRLYGLTFKTGDRVRHTVTGKTGVVGREDRGAGHYVQVRFGDQRHALPCHPQELEPDDADL